VQSVFRVFDDVSVFHFLLLAAVGKQPASHCRTHQ